MLLPEPHSFVHQRPQSRDLLLPWKWREMKTWKVQEGLLQQWDPSSPPAAATGEAETIHLPPTKPAKVDVKTPAGFSSLWCLPEAASLPIPQGLMPCTQPDVGSPEQPRTTPCARNRTKPFLRSSGHPKATESAGGATPGHWAPSRAGQRSRARGQRCPCQAAARMAHWSI